jgi:hypothetical protein
MAMAKKESVIMQQAVEQDLDSSVQVHEAIEASNTQNMLRIDNVDRSPFFNGVRS